MTWLDRGIGWLAPSWGASRAQSRAVMLAYDGAKSGRRTQNWNTPAGSAADVEVMTYLGTMRDRAHDLVRNNPHASKGLAVLVANRIGTGIMAQPVGPNKRRVQRTEERWKRFVDESDLLGKMDLYGQQSQAERTRVESGEALVRFVNVVSDGSAVPLKLHVMEPDYIDSSVHGRLSDGTYAKHGMQYDDFGRPTKYWLFDQHPGDNAQSRYATRFKSTPVDASEILHYFRPLRPGQTRGMTEFASVILRLRALDDYDDAEVMRKKIAACMGAAVTTPAGLPGGSLGPTAVDDDGNRVETFSPGMVGYFKPGEVIEFFDPKPSGDYREFNNVQLHAIASGLNVPYELLTGDLSEVTYTSHRGGLVQFRGMVEADQWQMTIPQIVEPTCKRFLREAARIDSGIDWRNTDWIFTPPRFGLLDPAKEIPAMIEAVQGGMDSYPNTLRREGYDWRETLDEIEEFQREVDKRGIRLTSIPGAPASSGNAGNEDGGMNADAA